MKEKASIEDTKKEEAKPEEQPKGIPEFWLTIFKRVDMLSDMLQVLNIPMDVFTSGTGTTAFQGHMTD